MKILTVLHNAELQIFNKLFLMGHTTHQEYQISSIKLIKTGTRRETEHPESTKDNERTTASLGIIIISPDCASGGREGADHTAEIRLRDVDLQRRNLRVKRPKGRRRSFLFYFFFVV